jgi:hypothetical protein
MTGASEVGQLGGPEPAADPHPALMESSASQLQLAVLKPRGTCALRNSDT